MSEGRDRTLVLLASAGMELCRLFAAGALAALIAPGTAFPYLPLAVTLVTALVLWRLIRQVRRRRITALVIHVTGFSVALFAVMRPLFRRSPSTVTDWLVFFMLAGFVLIFWLRGSRIGTRAVTYEVTVNRFDTGLGLLFAIYFLRLGVQIEDPLAPPLVAAFFLFGMVALYAARNLARDSGFLNSRSVLTLLIPFVSGFLLLGAAVALLYPYLTQAARDLYGVMRQGFLPIAPWLVAALRFLLGFGFGRATGSAAASGPAESLGTMPEELGPTARLIERILAWGFVTIISALALALTGILIWRIIKHLAARVDDDSRTMGFCELIRCFLRRLAVRLRLLLRRIASLAGGGARRPAHSSGEGAGQFRKLCAWGRRSGLPRATTETAAEYGRRLTRRFPKVGDSAHAIVTIAESELYGCRPLTREARRQLQRARRSLRSPGLYPARLAARLGIYRPDEAGHSY